MNILKQIANIFGGGQPMTRTSDPGLYYYVRCDRCGEVIKVRINSMNDLSQNDEGDAWFARKTIVGRRCYNRIEAEFVYDSKRQLTHTEITGGKLVTEEDYDEDEGKAAQA
jgi:hypothetical protein